ncbi:MAG: hypothetical protein IRY91_01575 [Gemmatimonadaceae bacterium]|nr:hypothetical protein [Gemmatimonadaceae bacterium]
MQPGHRLGREGVIAGIIGATSVAVWFLIVDLIAGHPLYTPRILGAGVASIFGDTTHDGALVHVLVYTIVHYAAFIATGIVVSYVVHKAETEPSVLVIFTLLFIIFELGVYGVIALLAETELRSLAWYQIAAGNLLAAAMMGTYMWRTHPALRQEFAHALGGDE